MQRLSDALMTPGKKKEPAQLVCYPAHTAGGLIPLQGNDGVLHQVRQRPLTGPSSLPGFQTLLAFSLVLSAPLADSGGCHAPLRRQQGYRHPLLKVHFHYSDFFGEWIEAPGPTVAFLRLFDD
ncbi:MAG: hypothetical protein V1913_00540 [Fibrobacterota bacterium]